jgi:hypothetical protein
MMTLIITEITPYGIAMVADGAYNFREMTPSGTIRQRVLTGARKLQYIPYLNAGVSMWGSGRLMSIVGEIFADIWMEDFIKRCEGIGSLEAFAHALRDEMQKTMGEEHRPLGFHLAGYEEIEGDNWPAFYHLRNCEGGYTDLEIHEFVIGKELGHDIDPAEHDRLVWYNGDYGLYRHVREGAEEGVLRVRTITGFEVPYPSLEGRLRYLAAWVKFVSDLYECSNLPREIGGEVDCLGIAPMGESIKLHL